MRAIWKGSIVFGLVNIPVKLYSIASSKTISFTLLHSKCQAPIKNQRVCSKCGQIVPKEELVRGVKYGDIYVIITDEDLKLLPLNSTKTLEIKQFVPADEVDPILFEKAYYLIPDAGSERAYHLLRKALHFTNTYGIGKITLRGKEHLAAVRPYNSYLVMHTLYYKEELKQMLSVQSSELEKEEESLAIELINKMKSPFNLENYRDEYTNALKELIENKIQKKVEIPKIETTKSPAKSLMEALKASVERASGTRKT